MLRQIIEKIFIIILLICILLSVFNSTVVGAYTGPKLSAGETWVTPDELKNNLYGAQLEHITAISTKDEVDKTQGGIHRLWLNQGSPKDAHNWCYVTIGGEIYYLIATGQGFGNVGDFLIITLQEDYDGDGNIDVYRCLMADAKGTEEKKEGSDHYGYIDEEGRHLGHMYVNNGSEKLDIMELVIDGDWTDTGTDENGNTETLDNNDLGQVASILNGGNDWENGPVGANGIIFSSTLGTGVSSSTFAENFKKNKFGTVINVILDAFVYAADGIQKVVNYSMRNSELHIGTKLRYTYSELESDVGPEKNNDGAGNRNAYTNVGGYVSGGNSASDVKKGQIGIDITESYYNSDTKIPLITIDMYNLAINDIDFFDINYFTGDETHEAGSAWMVIRNFVVAIIQAALYVSIILLITMLIWYGVALVSTGMNNPEKHRNYKEGINKFAVSIFMIIGVVLISSLCIFGTDALSKLVAVDSINSEGEESSSEYELPIRVHVSSAGYSFSTNFTGYIRYMIQIDDVDYYGTRAMYVFIYIGLVIMNVLSLMIMMFRVGILYLFVLYGLYITINYMFDKDAGSDKLPDRYVGWIKGYFVICAVQLFYAIIYRVLMQFILF